VYNGSFYLGRPHGRGKLTQYVVNGDPDHGIKLAEFDCNWMNGKRHGAGNYKYWIPPKDHKSLDAHHHDETATDPPADIEFEGLFEHGQRNGYGRQTIRHPTLIKSFGYKYYAGQWKDDYRHGLGNMVIPIDGQKKHGETKKEGAKKENKKEGNKKRDNNKDRAIKEGDMSPRGAGADAGLVYIGSFNMGVREGEGQVILTTDPDIINDEVIPGKHMRSAEKIRDNKDILYNGAWLNDGISTSGDDNAWSKVGDLIYYGQVSETGARWGKGILYNDKILQNETFKKAYLPRWTDCDGTIMPHIALPGENGERKFQCFAGVAEARRLSEEAKTELQEFVIYEGDWEKNHMHGEGKQYFEGSGIYEGQFLNGKRHGRGTWSGLPSADRKKKKWWYRPIPIRYDAVEGSWIPCTTDPKEERNYQVEIRYNSAKSAWVQAITKKDESGRQKTEEQELPESENPPKYPPRVCNWSEDDMHGIALLEDDKHVHENVIFTHGDSAMPWTEDGPPTSHLDIGKGMAKMMNAAVRTMGGAHSGFAAPEDMDLDAAAHLLSGGKNKFNPDQIHVHASDALGVLIKQPTDLEQPEEDVEIRGGTGGNAVLNGIYYKVYGTFGIPIYKRAHRINTSTFSGTFFGGDSGVQFRYLYQHPAKDKWIIADWPDRQGTESSLKNWAFVEASVDHPRDIPANKEWYVWHEQTRSLRKPNDLKGQKVGRGCFEKDADPVDAINFHVIVGYEVMGLGPSKLGTSRPIFMLRHPSQFFGRPVYEADGVTNPIFLFWIEKGCHIRDGMIDEEITAQDDTTRTKQDKLFDSIGFWVIAQRLPDTSLDLRSKWKKNLLFDTFPSEELCAIAWNESKAATPADIEQSKWLVERDGKGVPNKELTIRSEEWTSQKLYGDMRTQPTSTNPKDPSYTALKPVGEEPTMSKVSNQSLSSRMHFIHGLDVDESQTPAMAAIEDKRPAALSASAD